MTLSDGWLNLFKPKGISSAKVVQLAKNHFPKLKIGHAGTLDVEAAGVLPVGIGEATKLMRFLVDATKTYIFTIKFGQKTDTADSAGKIIAYSDNYPNKQQCLAITEKFIGKIKQTPNIFSAIKVNGQRSYNLARQGLQPELKERIIEIFSLNLIEFDDQNHEATYQVTCSKGTYIRSLAEDIALSLQTVGFVLELTRTRVGIFQIEQAINLLNFSELCTEKVAKHLRDNKKETDVILGDILVSNATESQYLKIKYGQVCYFNNVPDCELVKIYYHNVLVAIGSIKNNIFNSFRVFNLINKRGNDVDYCN